MDQAAKNFIDTFKTLNNLEATLALQKITHTDFGLWLDDPEFKNEFLRVVAALKAHTRYHAQFAVIRALHEGITNGFREETITKEWYDMDFSVIPVQKVKKRSTVKTVPIDPKLALEYLNFKQGLNLASALAVLAEAEIFPGWFLEFILSVVDDEKKITDERLANELQQYLTALKSK